MSTEKDCSSADDFDALQDTLAVLSDRVLLVAHRDGQQAIAGGDFLDADQLAQVMTAAGRAPDQLSPGPGLVRHRADAYRT